MTAKLIIDKAGRVVIPKPVRDEMHLSPGDSFEMEMAGEEIVLRPVRQEVAMRKERGMWVAYGPGKPVTLEETNALLRQIREERDAHNLGEA